MTHLLTLIIVSFNSTEVICRCLADLLDQEKYRVLIVDNASPDGSAASLSARFPFVDVITLGTNRGYGRAANAGLSLTTTPYALLLNPDLYATPEAIERLLHHAKTSTENTAIWGPQTHRTNLTNSPPQKVSWVHGSAMLFDVEKIRKVGLFDENIFLFSEETDLCKRTRQQGYSIQLCPDVFFDHLSGESSTPCSKVDYMKWWHFGWSQCYRITKHGQCTAWENPRRKQITYRLHSLLGLSAARRIKWRAKSEGAAAFLRGEKAFFDDDTPKMSP